MRRLSIVSWLASISATSRSSAAGKPRTSTSSSPQASRVNWMLFSMYGPSLA